MKTKILFISLILITLIFTSCRKDDIAPPTKNKPQNLNELQANSNFDWKTTKDYQFTLKGNNSGVVKIISESNDVYYIGFINANSATTIDITLPSFEKSVRLVYWGNDIKCQLNQKNINYTFISK